MGSRRSCLLSGVLSSRVTGEADPTQTLRARQADQVQLLHHMRMQAKDLTGNRQHLRLGLRPATHTLVCLASTPGHSMVGLSYVCFTFCRVSNLVGGVAAEDLYGKGNGRAHTGFYNLIHTHPDDVAQKVTPLKVGVV